MMVEELDQGGESLEERCRWIVERAAEAMEWFV